MPRHPGIWLRTQDGFYYTTVKRKKVRLAQDKVEARRALYALLARGELEEPAPAGPVPTFRRLADMYLAHTKATCVPKVLENRLRYLTLFCGHVGRTRLAADLRPHMVTAFVAKQGWAESTNVTARGAIVGCLRHAVREGHLAHNPLAAVKVGKTEARKRVLTKAERDRIRVACKSWFLDFLTACELTGARPFSEVAVLEARMIDWDGGVIELATHKNAKKGKSRTIYLTPPLAELLRRAAEKHPTGLLFRSRRGGKWRASGVCYHMRRLERDLGLPRLNFYCYRSCAITTALENGLTADVAAELYGNSAATIARHYNQLSERREALKAAAQRALG